MRGEALARPSLHPHHSAHRPTGRRRGSSDEFPDRGSRTSPSQPRRSPPPSPRARSSPPLQFDSRPRWPPPVPEHRSGSRDDSPAPVRIPFLLEPRTRTRPVPLLRTTQSRQSPLYARRGPLIPTHQTRSAAGARVQRDQRPTVWKSDGADAHPRDRATVSSPTCDRPTSRREPGPVPDVQSSTPRGQTAMEPRARAKDPVCGESGISETKRRWKHKGNRWRQVETDDKVG